MSNLFDNNAVFWTAIVAIGYPLSTLLIAELQRIFERTSPETAKVLRLIQITVLPLMAIYLLMSRVAEIPDTTTSSKIILTVIAITIMNVALAALNVAMRSTSSTSDWMARTPGLLLDLIRLFLVMVGAAFVASDIWSIDLGALLTALGVGSVVIGLALQDTLSGLFAGVSIMSGRQFKEGDWLRVGDDEGKIIAIDWRSVTILTEDNSIVVIPNSELSKQAFKVQGSQGRTVAEELVLSFPYTASPDAVFAALDETARSVDKVLLHPPHEIELIGMSNEAMQYELMYHSTSRETGFKAHSDLLRRLWYVCQRRGIEMAGETNRLYRAGSADINPSLDEKIDALTGSGLFPANAKNLDLLARKAKFELYDQGEDLQLQGGEFNEIHLVLDGHISVVENRDETEHVVQELNKSEIFFTRAFLTNAPSPVTLRAANELAVLTISRADMIAFLNDNIGLSSKFERLIDRTEAAIRITRPSAGLSVVAG